MTPIGNDEDAVLAMVKRLRAPAYWMSGSSEGHEGENSAAYEAADLLERIASRLARSDSKVVEALRTASEDLEYLARWRSSAHAHDEDMGHDPRDFVDDEDWDMIEGSAQRAAGKARAALEALSQQTGGSRG